MGAQTVRYLQYLLSIDFFEQNKYWDENDRSIQSTIGKEPNYDYKMPNVPIVDKSNYVASITSLNGAFNGTMTPHIGFGIDTTTHRPESWWSEGKDRS